MDKHFVGLDLTSFEDNQKKRPVSRVTFYLDNENVVTAGDDTGLEIQADCPHATKEMAEAVLEQLKGYQYQQFSAGAANIDPAAELGDGVTAGGVYSVIARLDDDGSGYPDVAAPGESEMDEEYPFISPMQQQFDRKIAETRSTISKTASEIALRIDGVDNKYTELSVTLDGVTITDPDGTTRIKGSSIETGSIAVGSIRADQINMTGAITWGDLDSGVKSTINSAASKASDAEIAAAEAERRVNAWSYGGGTYIDGSMIVASTIMAGKLKGGYVYLLDEYERECGWITIANTTTGTGVGITSHMGGMSLSCAGNFWCETASVSFGTSGGYFNAGATITPGSNESRDLGLDFVKWRDIFLKNSPNVSSDENQKHDIEDLPEKYLDMIEHVAPVRFKLNSGESGRYHVGFISQQVGAAMRETGIDGTEFGGYVVGKDEEGHDVYMLRYEEFIGILLAKIQQMDKRLKAVEGVA